MAGRADISGQQVADAIRAGLPNRSDILLGEFEASELAATYRDSLGHYRDHVQKSLAEGDYRQAAEKSWGAFTQTIEAIAAEHSLRVRSDANILRVSEQLTSLVLNSDSDWGEILDNGSNSAHSLHLHFYENDLPDETVMRRTQSAAKAVDLLQEWFGSGAGSA